MFTHYFIAQSPCSNGGPDPGVEKKKGLKISLQALRLTNFWCGWQESNPRPLGS
jgi:hypothetical protein